MSAFDRDCSNVKGSGLNFVIAIVLIIIVGICFIQFVI